MEDFHKRLILLRKKLGERRGKKKLLQEEMAQLVGVDKQTWWRYENTARSPDANVLQRLVQSVNLNPLWLLTGEGEMFMDQRPADRVAEASARYGLTDDERRILELLRGNPKVTKPVLKLLLSGQGLKEALAELQEIVEPDIIKT